MVEGLVSIITPSYNCSEFVSQTIKSVLSQTYENWEMIIVDDCSTDESMDVLMDWMRKDSRIRVTQLEVNSGAAVARTVAMQLAEGRYIAFLDSDDLWLPQKLQCQLRFMAERNCAFTATGYQQIDEQGRDLTTVIRPPKRTDYNRLLLDCPIGNSTVMYDVSRMGKFVVPNIRKRNDDALWLQMLKKEKYIYGISDILAKYRVREGSISSDKLDLVKYHWTLYRDIEHLSVPRSAFHIAMWGIIKALRIK